MRRPRGLLWMMVLVAGLATAGVQPVFGGRFGTACQEDFQNGWLPTLPYSWARCSNFNDELDDTDSKIFYYNLHGAKWWWEESGDQVLPETVNILFANTHGGGWSWTSAWAMWDQNTNASRSTCGLGTSPGD